MATLESVLKDFDQRIARLERLVQAQKHNLSTETISPDESAPVTHLKPRPPRPPRPQRIERENNDSTSFILGIIGIGFLILAGAFFIKLSIDSGWLTPTRQIFFASGLGIFMLIIPHVIAPLRDSYGSLLSGAGVATLHLSWFGAFKIHQLIGQREALIGASAVGILSILMNLRMGNAIFVLVAIAGTYLSAPLIGYSGELKEIFFFFIVWNVGFSVLSVETKRRDVLLVASYFAILTAGLLALVHSYKNNLPLAEELLTLQLIQFAIFVGATALFTLRNRQPLSAQEAWSFFPLLLLFYILTNSLVSAIHPELAPYYGLVIGLVAPLTYHLTAGRVEQGLSSGPAIYAFASIALAHSIYFSLTPDFWQPALSLGLGFAILILIGHENSGDYGAVALVVGALVIYGAIRTFDYDLPYGHRLGYHIAWGILAFLAVLIHSTSQPTFKSPLLCFGHVQILYALAELTNHYQASALTLTFAWSVYALLILGWAYARRDQTIGQSAVIILGAVSLKGALYDLSSSESITRILSLMVAGTLLYTCGWIYRRIKSW